MSRSQASSSRANLTRKSSMNHGRPSRDLCHKEASTSLLSHQNRNLNIRGLFNLMVILVVVQNARLVLENFIKYGVRIRLFLPPTSVHDLIENWPILLSLILMHIFFFGAFVLERWINPCIEKKFAATGIYVARILAGINAFMIMYIPYISVKFSKPEPLSATLLLIFSITWFLKLISFHFVLADVRYSLMHNETFEDVLGGQIAEKYPDSLSFKHYYNYLIMPTMCFQFQYPRTPKIRWISVATHLFEMACCLMMMNIVIQQYMVIILQNTFLSTDGNKSRVELVMHMFERLLKLSIPNLIVFLLGFVAIFHHWLNILGEITRFADRRFYSDWWNSASIGEYWRKWNIPIHNFVNCHLYHPLTRRKMPKMIAGQVVFILSALAHEYMVCVPLHIKFNGLIFSAFLLQMPLISVTSTKYFRSHPTQGNVLFWVLFCVTGQPLAIIGYYYLWSARTDLTV